MKRIDEIRGPAPPSSSSSSSILLERPWEKALPLLTCEQPGGSGAILQGEDALKARVRAIALDLGFHGGGE